MRMSVRSGGLAREVGKVRSPRGVAGPVHHTPPHLRVSRVAVVEEFDSFGFFAAFESAVSGR